MKNFVATSMRLVKSLVALIDEPWLRRALQVSLEWLLAKWTNHDQDKCLPHYPDPNGPGERL